MTNELDADAAFKPSAFWREINDKNLQMLMADGIDNFKRTLSHNYYSWLIVSPFARHFRYIVKDWLLHPTVAPLGTRIEPDLAVRLTTHSDPVVLSARQRLLYRIYVSCVWERMLRADSRGLALKVGEPDLGNPIRVWRNNQIITQDLANSIVEANLMSGLLSGTGNTPRIAELGAGSGRLAHVFSTTHPGTYHIFDIPPALLVSQWYLDRVLAGKRVFHFRHFHDFEEIRNELSSADVAFFTANQMAKFPPGYFDLIVSISTLPEARPDQVTLFLNLFQTLSKRFIYLKQWRSWKNPLDGTFLTIDDYTFGREWHVVRDEMDPINPLFFNRVWQRQ
ncbi:MAG TPA: putative sugar O-methyltransferase [Vicinamibacterales bacterium]|nr:putative sugar O-methyltransferase [Vicinamibacterales bacterium]